jgi:hypothetical protein
MAGINKTRILLQDRDRRLLEELETMRVIDREQAKVVAGFTSTTRANTRLLALTRAGLLTRLQLAGNRAAYQLASARAAAQWKAGSKADAMLYCEHQLAINEVSLTLRYRPVPNAGVRCTSWRRFTEIIAKSFPLIPDAYFELWAPAGIRPCFLEVDLGTESTPVLRRKFQLYVQLALSGEFPDMFSQPQFRVLVITTTARRLENLRVTAARLTDKIFWFATLPAVRPEGFWSASWLRPTGTQTFSLL